MTYKVQNYLLIPEDNNDSPPDVTEVGPRGPILPKELKEYLDRYVIGQDEAKKTLSAAIYNREMRRMNNDAIAAGNKDCITIDKSNVLLLGPTGTGKTMMLKLLAKKLDVPLVIEDATSFTETGYIGRDCREMFVRLINEAWEIVSRRCYESGKNPEEYSNHSFREMVMKLAHTGIIYIDEADKLAVVKDDRHTIHTASIQYELLKMVEDTEISLDPASRSDATVLSNSANAKSINTKDILFILGGSFPKLEEIVSKRLHTQGMGFGSDVRSKITVTDYLNKTTAQDLIEFGYIPEFIGRFNVHVALNPLTEKDLVNILLHSESSALKQYTQLFHWYGRKLKFTGEAVYKIAKLAIEKKVGARGLKNIIENSTKDLQFSTPGDPYGPTIVITAKHIKA